MPVAKVNRRTAGEGSGRTARVHVCEESDSGILPMNHSNKDGRLVETNPGSLLGNGEVRTSNLKISEEMRITLVSIEAQSFDIKEVDGRKDGIQTVLPGGGANWYWDVTPKEAGERHLRLIASIVVRSGSDERHQDFATFDTPIKVLVRPKVPASTRLGASLIELGEENWKWLLSLLPMAEIARRILRRYKVGRRLLELYSIDRSKKDNRKLTRH